jgi:hypothetical protein
LTLAGAGTHIFDSFDHFPAAPTGVLTHRLHLQRQRLPIMSEQTEQSEETKQPEEPASRVVRRQRDRLEIGRLKNELEKGFA